MATNRHQLSDYVTCKHCRKEFKAITFQHLRNIRGYNDDHPILDYKDRFWLQSSMCPESRQKIDAAKDTNWDRRGRHWTPRKVVAEIRRIHRAGESLGCRTSPSGSTRRDGGYLARGSRR
jgi:hypothetical protein